ncbi:hypothetical protein NUW54_g8498 [Trametes sanguinea]|uniref:Uncharacterized protein n=1 Tax=Trametes sanguinea TaxID=158606 RepID=A0ACC1PEJ4_9APHY|nr:hypothetical protein NUW54_g8498 [Trametes sanguinea]
MLVCQVRAGARMSAGRDGRSAKEAAVVKSRQMEAVRSIGRVWFSLGDQEGFVHPAGAWSSIVKMDGRSLDGVIENDSATARGWVRRRRAAEHVHLGTYWQDQAVPSHPSFPHSIWRVFVDDLLESNSIRLLRRDVDVLAGALVTCREVGSRSRRRELELPPFAQWRERKATRDYTAEMARMGALGSLEDGLVFLWAMERVYLDAWSHVKSLLPNATSGAGPALPAIKQLAENWTCPEFVQFVDALGSLVNRLSISPGSPAYVRAEEIWARVVELEEAFWPVGGEEMVVLSV